MRERKNEFGQIEVAFKQRIVLLVFFLATHPEHWLRRVAYLFSWSASGGVAVDGSMASSTVRPAACPFVPTRQFADLWPFFLQTKQRLLSLCHCHSSSLS